MIQDFVWTVNEKPSQLQFPFLPRPHTSLKRESREQNLHSTEYDLLLQAGFSPPGAGQAGVPFIFGVPLHDGSGPAL